MKIPHDWTTPQWPAPPQVNAYCTSRNGGISEPPYSTFNLAMHVGDDAQHVSRNRQLLRDKLSLPSEPRWLEQVHSNQVVELTQESVLPPCDASYTREQHQVCAVLTADCVPVLFCDREGSCVAAAHAGWRGLVNGIIPATIQALPVSTSSLMAWLGPAIGPGKFQVGHEVREQLIATDSQMANAFRPCDETNWYADLYHIARKQLIRCGVENIYGGQGCTYSQTERFFSYRRDGATGRMASLIWITSNPLNP